MFLTPGTRLGRYEILSPIAAGGMGQVYRARDGRLDREVAVKVLSPSVARDPRAVDRFRLEARAIAALSHPNILALHEFLVDSDPPCFVTELLTGETFAALLERGPVEWRTAVDYAIQIADGLSAAHEKRIVHRDLKPANVFLTDDGRIKILDFGLAIVDLNLLDGSSVSDDVTAVFFRDEGRAAGTLPYMSPEQVRGEETDPTSDIFALGSLLFELITGKKAFGRSTAADTIAALLNEQPPAAERFVPGIPATLAAVISRCLNKERGARFESARDLIATLRVAATGSGSSGVAPPLSERPAREIAGRVGSVAVLPFEIASDETASQYIADGVTETLIQGLAELPELRVMAAATVFRYRSRKFDPMQAGLELGVDVVVAGRVLLSSQRFQLTAELIDVRDGARLWGEQFIAASDDLVDVQNRLVAGLAGALRPGLVARTQAQRRHTESAEAYRQYMRGRFFWNKRTIGDLRKAVGFFQGAIEEDPTYGLAYSGLADCYSILTNYGAYEPRDGYSRARAAATRALEFGGSLAESHSSAAYVDMMHGWNLAEAANGFRWAIALNSNYPTAHHWYSHYFEAIGDHETALGEISRANDLDPLSVVIDCIVGFHLFVARRYDEAIAHLERLIENEPTFPRAHADLSDVLFQIGETEEAARQRILARRYGGAGREATSALEEALASGGVPALLETVLLDLNQRPVVPHVDVAVTLVRLDRHREALDALDRAFEARCDALLFLGRPHLDPVRGEKRFEALVARVRAETA